MKITVKVKKLDENAMLPTYGSADAAGADLYACVSGPVSIAPGETQFIKTGLALEIPAGYAGFVFARSGLSCRQGLAPANKVGVIDADYRGEIIVALHNHSAGTRFIETGDRIAQLVVMPVPEVDFTETDELNDTERGAAGFGSTGKK